MAKKTVAEKEPEPKPEPKVEPQPVMQPTEEAYPYIGAGEKAKSEAVKELFDFEDKRLPERTRLNEKQIQTFAMLKTQIAALDCDDDRPLPEVYMENIMRMNLSLKGQSRFEGMSIFQAQREEGEDEAHGGFKATV